MAMKLLTSASHSLVIFEDCWDAEDIAQLQLEGRSVPTPSRDQYPRHVIGKL